jgi:hypothetical protein
MTQEQLRFYDKEILAPLREVAAKCKARGFVLAWATWNSEENTVISEYPGELEAFKPHLPMAQIISSLWPSLGDLIPGHKPLGEILTIARDKGIFPLEEERLKKIVHPQDD